jgi:hypothetical protein
MKNATLQVTKKEKMCLTNDKRQEEKKSVFPKWEKNN